MKQLSLALLLLCMSFAGYSQITAASYGFTASSGTFTSISSTGTYATGAVDDDNTQTSIPIGFNFNYCGVDYNQLSACSNGWLSFGNYYGSGFVSRGNDVFNMATISSSAGILMPFWDDLDGRYGGGAAHYITTGSAPNRQFIFQWTNFEFYDGSTTVVGTLDFQVILHETTNQIDFVYNNNSLSSFSGSVTVGIGGAATADYQTLPSVSASPTPSSVTFTSSITGGPANGQIYTWTPPPPCSTPVVAGTAHADRTTVCAADNIILTVTGTTVATGFNYQWQVSPDGGTWFDISGGTTATINTTQTVDNFYRVIVSCPTSLAADTSTDVYVGFSTVCYCTPSYGYSPATSYNLDVVTLAGYSGSTLNDAGPAAPLPASGYQDRTSMIVDLQQGNAYAGTLSYSSGTYDNYESQIWIDFNDDGTFDVSEEVTPVISSGYGTYTFSDPYTLSVPISAPVGVHRMRVRYATDWSSSLSGHMDPCNSYDADVSYNYGTTRDYLANIIAAPACAGAPVGGTATATATLACPGTPFTLNTTGTTIASGLTYQWSSSATGAFGSYTPIAGATSLSYALTVTAPAYYQLTVTCPASGLFDTSASVFVNYFGFCYCVPSYFYAATGSANLDYVNLYGYAGSTISDAGPTPLPSDGYQDRTSITVDLQQGNTYSGDLSYSYGVYSYNSQIWIDFNDDGNFTSSEIVSPIISSGVGMYVSSDAFTINIPITAAVGLHRMRIRYANISYSGTLSTEMDPCAQYDATNTYYYGTTRDYMANIIALPACAGTPVGGTATASTTLGCPSTPFTLSTTGTTVAGSLTYQWQSSSTGLAGSFTDIPGATTLTYSYTESSPTYYQMVVTCAASSVSATSTPVFVNYFGFCYCVPTYYYSPATYYGLDMVDITGYAASVLSDGGSTPAAPSGYEDRTSVSVDMQQGGTYSGTLSYVTTTYSGYENQIWIDFNDDGVFDPSEAVTPAFGTTCGSYSSTSSYTISIPLTAPVGAHRMRVRNAMAYECAPITMDPCYDYDPTYSHTYYYGTTRDYMVNIITLPPCAGMPVAGASAVSPTAGGLPTVFTVSLPGLVGASGLSIQWQSSSSATGPWTNISGATTATYSFTGISADTWYQAVVICTATSDMTTSTPVMATYVVTPLCLPTSASWNDGFGSPDYGLDEFAVTGYAGSSINDIGINAASASGSGYLQRATIAPIDLQQGGVYASSGVFSPVAGYQELQVWIDFNDNGYFEAAEEVSPVSGYTTSTTATPVLFNITIPVSAATGVHSMRVRGVWEQTSTTLGTAPAHLDPCLIQYGITSPRYWSGTVTDYRANIIALPACTGTPVAGTAAVSPTAGGTPTVFTLSLPGLVGASGLSYQWQSASSATGPWTNISGATTAPYTFTGISSDTWFQAIVTCTATGDATTSAPVMATYVLSPGCVPTSSSWNSTSSPSYGLDEFTVTGAAGSTIADVGINSASAAGSGYLSRIAMTPVDMLQGGIYASSATFSPTASYQEVQVWVDFNDNGYFEATEEVSPVSGFSTGGTASPVPFNITIPSSATLGVHLMRVRGVWEQISTTLGTAPAHLDPCLVQYGTTNPRYWSGTVTDYRANIISPCPFTAAASALPAVCPGTPISLSATTTAPTYSWSGPGGYTATTLTATAPGIATTGTYTFVATDGTCSITLTVDQTLLPAALPPVVTPAPVSMCNGSIQTLTATVPPMLTTILDENFNAGLGAWSVDSTGTIYDGTSATVPMQWTGVPDAFYYSFNTFHSPDNTPFAFSTPDAGGSGSTMVSQLISPTFSLAGLTSATLTFDNFYEYYYADYNASADISTDGGATWTTLEDYLALGFTMGTPTSFQPMTYDLSPYLGNPNCKVRFYYNSPWGIYWAVDNVKITAMPVMGDAPTWSPVADLYTDAAGTTPYVAGTPAYNVYVHPTTVTSTTTTNYIASIPLGTCVSADTSAVTVSNAGTIVAGGSTSICAGSSLSLTNAVTGGTWSVSNPAIATVNASGVVTGIASGADTVYYTSGTCNTSIVVNVSTVVTLNTGTTVLCSGGLTSVLSNPTTGGTWSSSNPSVASVSATGTVTTGSAGTAIITYTLPSGCSDTSVITSVAPPAAITGTASVCYNGGATTLSNATVGGTWSTSAPLVATISTTTGSSTVVTGLAAGTANISYTTLPGCYATVALTLNANPANITGTMAVCAAGGMTTLSNVTGSGTWSSGTPARATITSGGVVTGVTSGTTVITYTAANGCYDTALVTVNALPAVITGTTTICNLASTTLADASTPGTWSTTTPTITTVNASGMVTGVSSGVGTIVYTQTSTGCSRSATVTVNALPTSITGASSVCNTATTSLSGLPTGGTWTSSNTAIASIGSGTGIVTGTGVGSAVITYTNASGCYITTPITVNASFVPSVSLTTMPATTVCAGATVSLTPTVVNGGTAPTFSWTVNGIPASTAGTYGYTPINGDVVALSIVSNLACAIPSTATASVTITVDPILTPSVSLATAYGDTGCAGAITTINTYPVSAGTGPVFQWFVNGSPVSGSSTLGYIATDGDVVVVQMTSTAGCLSGSTAVVSYDTLVLEVIPFVAPDVTLTSSTGSLSCVGNIVAYNATGINGGTAPAYLWTVNGVNVATGPSYFYIPADGDVVVVRMTSNYPCPSPASDTAQMTMNVISTITPVCTIAMHPGATFDTFTVNIVSGGGAAPGYQWYVNGVALPGVTTSTYITASLSAGDIVTCRVSNNDACGGITTSNSITVTSSSVNVNQTAQAEASISLMPNPNNGSFIVKGSLGVAINEDMILEVTDMIGQVVYTSHIQAKSGAFSEQIQLSGMLANGSYILNVRSQHMSKVFHFVLEQQ